MNYFATHSQNRRRFLKQSALGLGAATLSGLGLSSACAQGNDKKLGIALVGLGNYATNQLAPALQETQHCQLVGIVTGSPDKVPLWKEKYDIQDKNVYSYETFNQIEDNPDIDMVYVVLPNSMHAEYSIRAAQAGKHVICEKPMSVSVAEGQSMLDAFKTANRNLYIGYRLHFEPHHQEVMRLGQEQIYGQVKFFEGSFGFRLGDPTQWRLKKALAGGGALMDVGIYVIQGARYVIGEEPTLITAQEFKTDPVKFAEVDEHITWQMEFPGGAVANCSTSYNANIERLFGSAEKGWFDIRPAYGYGKPQGSTHEGPMQVSSSYEYQQAAHMDGISRHLLFGDDHRNVSGEEGLKDMKVIEAIYASIANGGKRVALG